MSQQENLERDRRHLRKQLEERDEHIERLQRQLRNRTKELIAANEILLMMGFQFTDPPYIQELTDKRATP